MDEQFGESPEFDDYDSQSDSTSTSESVLSEVPPRATIEFALSSIREAEPPAKQPTNNGTIDAEDDIVQFPAILDVEHPSIQKLRDIGSRFESSIQIFLKHFRSSCEVRHKWDGVGFEKEFLPKIDEMEEFFVNTLKNDVRASVQLRLASVQPTSIRKAAGAAVQFLVYLNKATRDKTDEHRMTRDMFKNVVGESTEARIRAIQAMRSEQKADLLVRFFIFYEKIPPARPSSAKKVKCDDNAARALRKENSTMRTVIRSILSFLSMVGAVQTSSVKYPNQESKEIWSCIGDAMKAVSLVKGGPLRYDTCSLSRKDLTSLMISAPDVNIETPFALQSFLFVIALVGSGLRVGSIRNETRSSIENYGVRRKRARNTAELHSNKQTMNGMEKENSEKLPLEDGAQVGAGRSDGGGRGVGNVEQLNLDEEDIVEEEEDADADDDEIDFDFEHLNSNAVRVYRLHSELPDDIRVEVEIDVQSTKTTGNQIFNKIVFGFSFPLFDAFGNEDRSPNAAVSLLMLSILAGNTSLDDALAPIDAGTDNKNNRQLISRELDDAPPLFRAATTHHDLLPNVPMNNVTSPMSFVARKLELPVSLFTTRACRRGFAKDLVEAFVARKELNTIVVTTEVVEMLNSSARWKSQQARTYINHILKSVSGRAHTDAGSTAFDWRLAIHRSSPTSRDFGNVAYATEHNYKKILESQGKAHLIDAKATHHKRQELIDSMNLARWNEAVQTAISRKELIERESPKPPRLNLRSTLLSLKSFIESNARLFGGCTHVPQSVGLFRCPVYRCTSSHFVTAKETDTHWKAVHASSFKNEQFLCHECHSWKATTWKTFRAHILKHHTSRAVFRWCFEDTFAEATRKETETGCSQQH